MKVETLTLLAPYITFITGIVAAYLTYKNQLRLKSFELLLKRREEVLSDMENEIKKLQQVVFEINKEGEKLNLERFQKDYFHNGIILYHKVSGANFGTDLEQSYYHILMEKFGNNNITVDEFGNWIFRMLNILSILYGYAHSNVNREIEIITLPWYSRIFKRCKNLYIKFEGKITNIKNKRIMKKNEGNKKAPE